MRKIFVVGMSFCCMSSVFAATSIDLSHQPVSFLQAMMPGAGKNFSATASQATIKQVSSTIDQNKTQHTRIQQMYAGYPVWGADAVVHVPQSPVKKSLSNFIQSGNSNITMNGTMYQNLNTDLANTPAFVFNAVQADKALQQAVQKYQQQSGVKHAISRQKSVLMVYVDDKNKAHWAFMVSFYVQPDKSRPVKPTYIMDAVTFDVYEKWDDIKTLDDVNGGGYGGNQGLGKYTYDGVSDPEKSFLNIKRDSVQKICYLENAEVTVKNASNNDQVIQYKCEATDATHNSVYWNGDQDAVNGAYSPANDALFFGKKIKDMYQLKYQTPVLVDGGHDMMLNMRVHDNASDTVDNAYWDDDTQQMTFGDGDKDYYPFVSLGVSAHEISHGFTHQHSNLAYNNQSGGLNESFSDMAAMAVEYYVNQKNTWQIGGEIVKEGTPFRYMDQPSKDCHGSTPGKNCSMDDASQFKKGVNVHYSSGVFNRAFYLLATSQNWNTEKAFKVMMTANMNYWTSTTNFVQAACGVVKATRDVGYDTATVTKVMQVVKVDISKC